MFSEAEAVGRWQLSPPTLALLLRRLADDPDEAAREYESIRSGLLIFFEVRGAADPAVLADEVIDRVARRLEQQDRIDRVRAFVYGVARNVARESVRREARERIAAETQGAVLRAAEVSELQEARIACLERCLKALPEQSRALIVRYYEGRGGAHQAERRLLAQRFGISYENLKMRAYRIRNALESCLHECLKANAPRLPAMLARHSKVEKR